MNEEICSYFVCIEYPNTCMDCEGKGKSCKCGCDLCDNQFEQFCKRFGEKFPDIKNTFLKDSYN